MTTSRASHRKRGRRSGAGRFLLPAALAAGTVVLLAGALLVGLRLARPGVLPGVAVGGAQVGGMEPAELRETVERSRARRRKQPVTAKLDDGTVTTPGSELGYDVNVDATVEAALYRGRQGNPLTAYADHIRAFNTRIRVPLVESVDGDTLTAWVDETARKLEQAPVEGTVEFQGTEVVRIDPQPGAQVVAEALREDARAALLRPGPDTIVVESEPVAPLTTTDDVDALVNAAERAVSAPVRLVRNDGAVTFEPEDIGELLRVKRTTTDGDVQLRLVTGRKRVASLVSDDTITAVESDPVDAEISLTGGQVDIEPSSRGFRFQPEAARKQLLKLIRRAGGDGVREAKLKGKILQPERSTQDARDLGITEQVSEFTTNHACCETRVANIQRFADLVAGAVIEPGETFSLNGHVGERTKDKGFVGGGAILDGEFVEQVGGGVSQFATTFFNAAFFGGYEFVEYKPHSYYISRYPVGREATINYPTVDLEILNNSPYGILVDTSYTDTSITVALWGTKWVEVESITGEPRNVTTADPIVRTDPELAPGQTEVVQAGGREGFDIVVTRVLQFPDGRTEREDFFTRYLPEPTIIERGPREDGDDEQ